MPYDLVYQADGTYKVCKVSEPTKCFSKKGMSKKKAIKQMQAIMINEKLVGGVIDKDTFLRRQSKGIYKGLTYDQFVDLENKDRQRVNAEINQLNEQNKQYDQFIKENPEYEEVMCSFDDNGDANKTRTTKAQCKLNHNKAKRKEYDKSIMGKAVNALTDIADFAVDNLPIIPEPVKDIYKKYGPSTSKFSGNGKKSSTNKFKKQLESIDMTEEEYLTNAKKVAKMRGYNPNLLTIADDNDHKLDYNGTKFGAVGYQDQLIIAKQVNDGTFSFEYLVDKIKQYRQRAHKVMKATNNKYSASSLSYYILW